MTMAAQFVNFIRVRGRLVCGNIFLNPCFQRDAHFVLKINTPTAKEIIKEERIPIMLLNQVRASHLTNFSFIPIASVKGIGVLHVSIKALKVFLLVHIHSRRTLFGSFSVRSRPCPSLLSPFLTPPPHRPYSCRRNLTRRSVFP